MMFLICWSRGNNSIEAKGSTDKFSAIILTHLFCPLFVGKSSTEHHSASGLPPQSDEKIYANLTDFILSAIPKKSTLVDAQEQRLSKQKL